jgi:hypothetical protein
MQEESMSLLDPALTTPGVLLLSPQALVPLVDRWPLVPALAATKVVRSILPAQVRLLRPSPIHDRVVPWKLTLELLVNNLARSRSALVTATQVLRVILVLSLAAVRL